MPSCDRATPSSPSARGRAATRPAEADPAARPSETSPNVRLSRLATLFFAVAAGIAVSNVYFAQPLLVSIGQDFGLGAGVLGLVVTATQVGYGLGLFLLVPLGDMVNRRRLIVAQFGLMALALLATAVAPNALVLLAGMAAVGLLAVVTQALVAFAAALAGPARRGRVVGTVTSGVVIGILSARAVSGALADLAGWRAVYFASAALAMVIGLAAHRVLPRGGPVDSSVGTPMPYRRLLGSTVELLRRERTFRVRGMLALLTFGAFSTLWSCLALPLSAPPLSLSHTAIGAFGLIGVAGAVAAVPAGRLNDRGFARWTTGGALILLTLSWLPIALAGQSLWALAGGVVLLDLAVQTVHVTNQSLVLELAPDAGSRLIGGYMIFYSVGSGAGAIASTAAYALAGWTAVCGLGAALSLLALLLWARTQRVSLG
ncbi:MAG TPA: MFS transporter [Pseudonocardia sp.]|nr:MFS transporter [Pseudonocardia sp.]